MTKYLKLLLVLSSFFGNCSASVLAAENAMPTRRAGHAATAVLTIERLKKHFPEIVLDAKWKSMQDAMAKDKKAHVKTTESRKLCEELAREELIAHYEAEAKRILDTVDPEQKQGHRLFTDEERQNLLACPDGVLDSNVRMNFSDAFAAVRRTAVSEEWGRFADSIYPSVTEFEGTGRQALREKLVKRLADALEGPIFEENEKSLGSYRVDPALELAETQRERQKAIVSNFSHPKSKLPEQIEEEIGAQIEAMRKGIEKNNSHAYAVFPSVEGSIPARAETVAIARFEKAIDGYRAKIERSDFVKLMKRNLQRHVSRDDSRKYLKERYWSSFAKLVIDSYTEDEESAEKLRSFLDPLLKKPLPKREVRAPSSYYAPYSRPYTPPKNSGVQEELDELIERTFREEFDNARSEIAEQQLSEWFKPLADDTWKPSEKLIESFDNEVLIEIEKPLEHKGVTSDEPKTDELFEETVRLVTAKERSAITKGLSAFRSQMGLVEQCVDVVAPVMETLNPAPKLDKVIELLTDAVKAAWTKKVYAEDYPELFGKVKERIETEAKAMLQRETARRQAMAKKSGKGSGSGSGGGSGDGGGGATGPGGGMGPSPDWAELPNLVIDFDTEGMMVSVAFSLPDEEEPFYKFTLDPLLCSKPFGVREQAPGLPDWFAAWIKESAKEKADADHIDLYIFCRVRNGSVCYGAINGVRRCIGQGLGKAADNRISLYWFDDYYEGGKGPFPKFKSRSRAIMAMLESLLKVLVA